MSTVATTIYPKVGVLPRSTIR